MALYSCNWCNSLSTDITLLYLLMKKLFFVLIVLILSTSDMYSQCSMLSAIMESDQEYEAAKGLNRGIVYLMSIPYILVGLIIWKIYRTNKTQ